MNKFYTLTMLTLLCGAGITTSAQNFQNGDLEGDIHGVSSLPSDWQAIPFTDIACRANESYKATPDLTNYDGLPTSVDISGTPQSGGTFISALDFGPGWHHEGIQQKLTRLIIGQVYRVHFYQSVIKQDNALDTSGSWAVYMDNQLLGISSVTSSLENFASRDTKWEKRSIEFEATSESHLIKFLPADDDNVYNHNSEDGNLRMGIDNISLEELVDFEMIKELEMSIFPNPTLDQFNVKTDLEKYDLTIMDTAGRIVLYKKNCSYMTSIELELRGVFMVKIQTQDQFAVRRVVIQ
jgi:Secretion system C-terminal sorting domain